MTYGGPNGHVTLKDRGYDPNILRAQYLKNSWRCYLAKVQKIHKLSRSFLNPNQKCQY